MKEFIAFIKALFAQVITVPARAGVGMTAVARRIAHVVYPFKMSSTYIFEAFDPYGNLKWRVVRSNIVVDEGINDLLDKYLKGSAYTAAFFVGLTDSAPTIVAGDTAASHAGWVEITAYDEATREALVLGTVAAKSVDNSASVASFAINANATTIGGAFVGTSNVKGGTAGVLYGVAALGVGDKTLDAGDTLNVTVTLTGAAS